MEKPGNQRIGLCKNYQNSKANDCPTKFNHVSGFWSSHNLGHTYAGISWGPNPSTYVEAEVLFIGPLRRPLGCIYIAIVQLRVYLASGAAVIQLDPESPR